MNAKAPIEGAPPGEPPPRITCAGCGDARDRPATRGGGWRVPAGWKRLHDQFWCPTCKRQRFALRAIVLPVSGPADGTWAELRAVLHAAFGETTRCANWLVTQFYARDRQREPGDARLPAMPRVYLYPEARTLFPALASQTLASLEQQVLARYRAARLALVWRHAVSLPTYRYPTPLPLPARMWTLARRDERWHLSVFIGDRRWSLRLRQGPGMARQLRVLRQVAAGTLEAGEATLYEIAAHRGDHRSESAPDRRLMVKMAVWLARREAATSAVTMPDGTSAETSTATTPTTTADILIVRTTADAFLTAAQVLPRAGSSGDTWTLHGAQVRRWIADAVRRREQLHEAFASMQSHGRHPRAVLHVERQLTGRLHRRLHDWTHQATAWLIAWATRRGVTTIVWDDTDRGFLPTYPWQQFATTLTDKAAVAGIRVILAEYAASHDEGSVLGHLQAEARARPGTLAGRDRSWERAQVPEMTGRLPRRLRGERDDRHDGHDRIRSPRDAAVDSTLPSRERAGVAKMG